MPVSLINFYNELPGTTLVLKAHQNFGDDPYLDRGVQTRAKRGNHQSGQIELALKIIKSGSKCIESVSRLMRGGREKRLV